MSKYWSPIVSGLKPYTPGEQPKMLNLVKLNTNENPFGPSPKVLDAIAKANDETLRLYPDPNADGLRKSIATLYGLQPDQVFVGNGSDEVLGHAFLALCKHDAPLRYPDITYSFYPVYCGLYGIKHETVPLTDDMRIDVDDYLTGSGAGSGAIIVCNPNAPTGCALPLSDIERLVAGNPQAVVIVDEAYVDFGAESATSLISRYPNLLVIMTLSKSYALAGLRVGFALGDAALIDALNRVKNSFNSYPLDRLALVGATAAIEDQAYFRQICQGVIDLRESMTTALTAHGFDVLPSKTNFVFARHRERDAAELAAALREHGVIVRHFTLPRIDQYLRISVGSAAQCDALNAALTQILG